MAHLKQGKEDRQRLIRPIVNFTAHLRERITTSGEAASSTLISELKSHISTLRTCGGSLLDVDHGTTAQELDSQAIGIWNLATRLHRESEGEESTKFNDQLTPILRVFAFHLLDSIDRSASKSATKRTKPQRWKQTVRILRTGLKTAKHCLQCDLLEHAAKVLERGADLVDVSEKLVDRMQEAHDEITSAQGYQQEVEEKDPWRDLQCEYFRLRVMLAWKQGNLGLARIMFQSACGGDLDAPFANGYEDGLEKLADLSFEIGRDLFQKQDPHASTWLEYADTCLEEMHDDAKSPDTEELHLSILHLIVRDMTRSNSDLARFHAEKALAAIEKRFPDRMLRHILRLDLMLAAEDDRIVPTKLDVDIYFKTISQMLRTVHMTSKNFDMLLSYIRKLKDHDIGKACQALDDLLVLRLMDYDNEDWIKKTFITRLWMSTDHTADVAATAITALQEVMSTIHTKLQRPLDGKAVHAAQTLLWKCIDICTANDDWTAADGWSRISLHPLLANAGDANTAKIARRAISCAIARDDLASARSTFNQMTETARKEPLTQYLAYKIALREHDEAFATDCFEVIAAHSEKDPTLLYACVLEAQQSGSRAEAIRVLRAVLAKQQTHQLEGVHVPTLFRCTLRLMVAELSAVDAQGDTVSDSICDLFEQASRAVKTGIDESFSVQELDWFVTNSYNLALKHYSDWPTARVLRLLDVCCLFCRNQYNTPGPRDRSSICKLDAVVSSLAAQCCLKLARNEDDHKQKQARYFEVMQHVEVYNASLEEAANGDALNRANFQPISRRLVISHFEALVQLKRWEELWRIVERVRSLDDPKVYNILTDMLLPSAAPASVRAKTLQQIIHASQSAGVTCTPATQARWFRIMYQLAVQSSTGTGSTESDLAHEVVQEILSYLQKSNHPSHYPAEELEYLATSTYNRAIDAYVAGDEARCGTLGKWAAEFAMAADNVTGKAGRDGRLSALIESKLKELLAGDVGYSET